MKRPMGGLNYRKRTYQSTSPTHADAVGTRVMTHLLQGDSFLVNKDAFKVKDNSPLDALPL